MTKSNDQSTKSNGQSKMAEVSQPDPEYKASVLLLTESIKSDLIAMLKKYGEPCAALARNSTDPHTPVVCTIQIAFASAAAEYLISQGLNTNLAVGATINATQEGMGNWMRAVLKNNQNNTVLHKQKPNRIIKPKKSIIT